MVPCPPPPHPRQMKYTSKMRKLEYNDCNTSCKAFEATHIGKKCPTNNCCSKTASHWSPTNDCCGKTASHWSPTNDCCSKTAWPKTHYWLLQQDYHTGVLLMIIAARPYHTGVPLMIIAARLYHTGVCTAESERRSSDAFQLVPSRDTTFLCS